MDLFKNTSINPDVHELLRVIKREVRPKRVHFIELFLDDEIKTIICEYFELARDIRESDPFYGLKREIRIHEFLGYDVFRVPLIHKDFFRMHSTNVRDTTTIPGQHRGEREWTEEHDGPIGSWEDFEHYPWPKVSDINFGPLEWLEKNLPQNMGCYDLTAHILEMITFLLGYETFCFKMVDEPDLVYALSLKVGEFYVELTRTMCDFSCVPLVWGSDDMGFRSGTLASPDYIRKMVLPWHKKCAEVAHEKDRPYLLHN
jgi:uroporphyrinogen decarboxylase